MVLIIKNTEPSSYSFIIPIFILTDADSEILGNVKAFFVAGSDTTSVVITWAMYEFCINPELLKQVQEEVDRVMQGSTDYAMAAVERKLPLCAACFMETVRLRGPAPFVIFNTVAKQPITLSNGIIVNPGDDVNCFLDAIHLDEKVIHLPRTALLCVLIISFFLTQM